MIYSILVGCNYKGGLKGAINDAKKMYNMFYYFHKRDERYKVPIILTDDKEKIETKKIQSVAKNIHENHPIDKKYTIIFFFAGHGHRRGKLGLSNINGNQFINIITAGAKSEFSLLCILDCCHAGSFNIPKHPLIKNVNIIASCRKNERSSESVSEKKGSIFNEIEYAMFKNNNYYVGVFTYNFVDLVEKYKKIDLDKIIKDMVWLDVGFIAKQNISIQGKIISNCII